MKRILFLFLLLGSASILCGAEFNVRQFGAVGDGQTSDTVAIQKTIDAAAEAGGGTVFFPPGIYQTGSIYLKSHIDFYIGPGATLKGSSNREEYRDKEGILSQHHEGEDNTVETHLIYAVGQSDITLRGPGEIDGNVSAFLFNEKGEYYTSKAEIAWRPAQMVYFLESKNIRVYDITLKDSPYWTLFLHGCEQATIRGVRISTLRKPHTYNGDGIDIDCCRFVTVSDCAISTSDDSIAIRADEEGLKNPQTCENITITNSILSSDCNAIRVGVGTGKIQNVVFSNLMIEQSRVAFNIFSNWSRTITRGVDISNIRFSNIAVDCKVLCWFRYGIGDESTIENIYFTGISGTAQSGGDISGRLTHPLHNIQFHQLDLFRNGSGDYFGLTYIDGLVLDSVKVTDRDKGMPAVAKTDKWNLDLSGTNMNLRLIKEDEAEEYNTLPGHH